MCIGKICMPEIQKKKTDPAQYTTYANTLSVLLRKWASYGKIG